jgi:hypothetical protein
MQLLNAHYQTLSREISTAVMTRRLNAVFLLEELRCPSIDIAGLLKYCARDFYWTLPPGWERFLVSDLLVSTTSRFPAFGGFHGFFASV